MAPTRKQDEPRSKKPTLGLTIRDIVISSGLFALFATFFARGGRFVPDLPKPSRLVDMKVVNEASTETCGLAPHDGHPVIVEMLYSSDKQAWIDEAATRFAKICPKIQIKAIAAGGIEGADSILKGEVKPTIWSPADDLVVRYLDGRWRESHGRSPIDITKQVSLARSPLVILIWEDRLEVLEAILEKSKSGEGLWMDAMCPGVPRDPQDLEEMALEHMVPGTWSDWYGSVVPAAFPQQPAPAARRVDKKSQRAYIAPFPTADDMKRWGRAKFEHPSPTRSAEGLEALYLMAYDYALPPNDRPTALKERIKQALGEPAKEGVVVRGDLAEADFARSFQERREPFQRWLKRCEAGAPPPTPSAPLLTDAIFDLGASRYDAVVTQEQLVFTVLQQFEKHADVMAELRVVYPRPTLVNEHPVVIFDDGTLTAEQRTAAEKWITFLRGPEMQKLAVKQGLRPASPELKLRSIEDSENPFFRFRRYGVEIDAPFVEAPRLDGKFVNELVRAWRDATGRH
ncbi:substrate-binding domain-containing protein [Polyangium jinanense]|uniref:Substrate-binding domain-containing protein n=1 Tax=Polyangium jinanense TaxID=2829994 RepID=A0A9X3XBW3_9BACT|nr:substrate-binding domain-containing protein [Polyangium jinanense]MDC3961002.1 substrate-binding domain-containing protein [Polyangium jinanense]MDC3987422.1 substrate-binding domain-containing protein [Polyangium jinanense]